MTSAKKIRKLKSGGSFLLKVILGIAFISPLIIGLAFSVQTEERSEERR